MKIAVTTLYTPEIADFSEEAVKNFRMYCDLHGYDLFAYGKSLKQDLRGNWCKPKVLLNHIKDYDYVVWLDSDIAILDINRKLEDIIEPHKDKLFIATDDMGAWHINNGFMIFKNTKYIQDMLGILWKMQSEFTTRRRGDQKFFIDFLEQVKLPKEKYHLYPQSEICAPLLLKNDKSFSVHIMGIHINDVRKEYIKHINSKHIAKKQNKNVIYVVNAYDNYKMPDIWQYTKPTLQSYCDKYNIDIIEFKPNDLNKYVNRAYFKIDAIDEFVSSDYNNVVIMDNDIAITSLAPDIFKEFDGGVRALDISKTHKSMFEYFNTTFHDQFYPDKQKPQFSINSGLVMLDRLSAEKIQHTRQNLDSPEKISQTKTFKRDKTFTWEQEYFTYLINESDVKFKPLNYKFNFLAHYLQSMSTEDWSPKLSTFYFLHMVDDSKTIGLRCLREYKNYFEQIPEPPFVELPRDKKKDMILNLKSKQKQFLHLKDKWADFIDGKIIGTYKNLHDWIGFVSETVKTTKPPKEKYSCYNAGKRIGIVTLYTSEIADFGVHSEISIKQYAEKQGYTFHVYRETLDSNAHPNWSKPRAIMNHIDDHDVIIWMDADTIIFNPEKKFETILARCVPMKKVIACKDVGIKGSMLNSGVLMFRNHQYSKNIIKKWMAHECDKSGLYTGGGDQNVLCDILKRVDGFGHNTKIFPMNTFNTDPRLVDDDTFILHFMAYPHPLKKIFMSYWNS
jgi:hypothetical protein